MDNKKTINKKKTQKTGSKLFYSIGSIFILVLAALAFVLIPALTSSSKRDEIIVGKWNKKAIKYEANSDFTRNVEYYSNAYKQQGYEVNNQNFYSILDNAFTATVMNMAITEAAEKAGYIPSEQTINRALLPYFYDTQGKYSAKIFNDTPDSQKIEYRNGIINNLKYASYVMDYFPQSKAPFYGLKTSTNESKAIAKMNAVRKGFKFVVFEVEDYPQEQSLNFAKENPSLFTEYNFSIISFESESKAKSVLKQLQQNEITLFDAVESFSNKNYSDNEGRFNYQYQYQIKPLLASDADLEAVLSIAPNTYSPIVKTSNSFSIFFANEEPKSIDFTNEAIPEIVLSYLIQYEMGRIQDYFTGLANDFSLTASLNDFETAAEKYALPVNTLDPFALNYGNSELLYTVPKTEIEALANAEKNENFFKSVFALNEGEVSSPILLSGDTFVFQCTESTNELTESEIENYSYIYAYYANQFNENSFYNYFIKNDKTENNVLSVYLAYFYQF